MQELGEKSKDPSLYKVGSTEIQKHFCYRNFPEMARCVDMHWDKIEVDGEFLMNLDITGPRPVRLLSSNYTVGRNSKRMQILQACFIKAQLAAMHLPYRIFRIVILSEPDNIDSAVRFICKYNEQEGVLRLKRYMGFIEDMEASHENRATDGDDEVNDELQVMSYNTEEYRQAIEQHIREHGYNSAMIPDDMLLLMMDMLLDTPEAAAYTISLGQDPSEARS